MPRAELLSQVQEKRNHQEQCGVTGIFSKVGLDVSVTTPLMQQNLHHRGRDSSGMAAFDHNGNINVHRGEGSAVQVFGKDFDFQSKGLRGIAAIGHNRYGTSGGENKDSLVGAQPVVVQWQDRKLAVAYNGNLPDSERKKLKAKLPSEIPPSQFDTQDLANAIVTAPGNTWEEKISNGLKDVTLAYSLTMLTDKGEVFGLRCPAGTWPLWVGENSEKIIFASEDTVSDDPSLTWSEVKPGELVKATVNGVERTQLFKEKNVARCSLHDVYGARRDSLITEGGRTYRDFSVRMGELLAGEHPIDADLYLGLPKSGTPIAEGYARRLGKLAGNNITAKGERSFIAQNGKATIAIIDGKYKIEYPDQIAGKKAVVLDDTVIKGSTLGGDPQGGTLGVVGLLRKAGAREVHIGLVLPKFTSGCDMGYYIVKDTLVAVVKTSEGYRVLTDREIADKIGADSVFFLSHGGVKKAYKEFFGSENAACMACTGGEHPLFDRRDAEAAQQVLTLS